MDVIESIKKDKAYLKCKLIVKNWENHFKAKYSRTPSKFDIKEAPTKIKYAYKQYFHLKSGALENSLLCEIEDNPPIAASPEFVQPLEEPDVSSSQEFFLPALPTACELDQLLSTTDITNKAITENPFTKNLSKKLFKNRRFSLRNPRKAIINKQRFSQSNDNATVFPESKSLDTGKCSLNKLSDKNDFAYVDNKSVDETILGDLDPVLSQATQENITNNSAKQTDLECSVRAKGFNYNIGKDKECKVSDSEKGAFSIVSQNMLSDKHKFYFAESKLLNNDTVSSYITPIISQETKENSTNNSVRKISLNWLERATGFIVNEKKDKVPTENFGISNINLADSSDTLCDVVENSDSEDDIAISKLKPALKKQKTDFIKCNNVNNINNEGTVKDNKRKKIEKTNNKKNAIKLNNKKAVICESDPPDIQEFLPFGLQEKCNPRHTNISDILNTTEKSTVKDNITKLANEDKDGKLLNKMQSGTLNDNFVKINIEKKVFVRGKKTLNYSKYKKKQWKDKKALHAGMEFPESGKVTCFKCGSSGHMARYCSAHKENGLMPLENYQDNDLPTLEEMQDIVNKQTDIKCTQETMSTILYEASQVPDKVLKLLTEVLPAADKIQPVLSTCDQSSNELFTALKKFGHSSFRPGQEQAIKRILCGKSTLLILSTGSGKSLCYQLPAYIYSQHYKCVTLVISPLVSLMEDQVLNMPEFVKAGCLHTNQQPTQRQKIIELLKNGHINILLISPEALIAGDTSNGFTGLFKSLPPIAFACIDEAHCVSQWSHNFRPSYLMICRVLREKLNVKCILGLTATASQTTIRSIIDHINVPDGMSGVLTNPALPDNLYLSMSFEKNKDKALISMLSSEKISNFNSVIIYCIRRNECERVAAIIRSCLSQPSKINMEKQNKKRKRMSYIAEAYHAGMSAAQRKKIQNHFMDGTLKIIVATVAFGMGINKSDIRCIIHYNMPPSFESYVQEVGRAGRDGLPAFCHVFMNNSNCDKDELLKHIHANSIDRPVIRKFLQKVFIPCNCGPDENINSDPNSTRERCKGHEVGIPIDNIVEELDLPSENIATLLCYVELHREHYIKVLNNAYIMCKMSSYGGPTKLVEAAKTCPPLAMAYILESKHNPEHIKCSVLEFNVIEVAAAIGWESGMTKYRLKNLEWITVGGCSQKSQLKVEFNTLGFKIKAPGDLSATELDSMLDDLHGDVQIQEKVMLYQLEEIHTSFSQLCNVSCELMDFSENSLEKKSNELKFIINNYFMRETNVSDNVTLPERPLDVDQITLDVRALIATYKDCTFTGRSIARIFQGITSPNYPALVWGRCKFWRSHLRENFYGIIKIATQEIIKMKCNF